MHTIILFKKNHPVFGREKNPRCLLCLRLRDPSGRYPAAQRLDRFPEFRKKYVSIWTELQNNARRKHKLPWGREEKRGMATIENCSKYDFGKKLHQPGLMKKRCSFKKLVVLDRTQIVAVISNCMWSTELGLCVVAGDKLLARMILTVIKDWIQPGVKCSR